MAAPTLELICCSNQSHVNSPTLDRVEDVCQITAIVSSFLSIVGATFTLLPRKVSGGIFRKRMIEGRQYNIVQMLAATDLLACFGIICLEILLLAEENYATGITDNKTNHGFCLFFTAWIQYFYITTYFLTASYAIDVYLMLKEIQRGLFQIVLHTFCFLCPLFLVTAGVVSLYKTSKTDTALTCISNDAYDVIPLYLASYLPMLTVMVMNPVIYYLALNRVKPILKGTRGQFTDKERTYIQSVQKKFLKIVAVFFICWWPNIILGAINLYYGAHNKQLKPTLIGKPHLSPVQIVTVILWFCMGVLNPLQAFLNTLVYVGWGGCCNIALLTYFRRKKYPTHVFEDSATHSEVRETKHKKKVGCNLMKSLRVNEHTPLMSSKTSY